MINLIKKPIIVLTSAIMMTSSIGINPHLTYEWNNCINSKIYIVALGQWGEIVYYDGISSDYCNITITVQLYDYQTFLKLVETNNSIMTTTYYSTNIYGYRIIESTNI